MKASLRPVRFMEVDWEDTTFAVPGASEALCRSLEASFERSGVLSPPILWAGRNDLLVIVDGFKRLAWLKRQTFPEIECFVCPSDIRRKELIVAKVETKLFGPPMNGAEKAGIVSMLSGAVPEDVLLRTYLPALDIPGRRDACARWLRLAAAGEEVLGALAADVIDERAALELAGWCEGAREAMLSLLAKLRCSASIQMEILERVEEIAVRDDCTPEQLLGHSGIQAILLDSRMHHRQKTQALRDLLDQMRFPRLKAREARVQHAIEEIPMPRAARLAPPPAFEGDRWRLYVEFSNAGELCSTLQEMESLAASNRLDALIIGSTAAKEGEPPGRSAGGVAEKNG